MLATVKKVMGVDGTHRLLNLKADSFIPSLGGQIMRGDFSEGEGLAPLQ
jgi:hypothetical protein